MANGDLIRFRQGSRADVGTTAKQAGQLLFATYEDEILTTQGTESFVQGDIYVDLSDGPSGIRVNLANDVDKARTLFAGETSTNDAAGNWTATIDGITKLYDGLTIALRLNSTYSRTYNSLNVNNLGAKIVWYRKNSRLTSHVPNGAEIFLTYRVNAGSYTTPSSGSRTDIPKGTTCTDGWILITTYDSNTVPSAYCTTGASTAAKSATCSGYVAMANSYIHIIFSNTNTANVPTLNINSSGAKPIYLNGQPVSSSNHNIKAGSYIAYYDGTAYYLRNDGILPGRIENALTADDATLAATASEAIKLSNTHTFQVDLGSTSVSTGFDGTQNIHDIGVTGTLGVQQGGTGTGTLAAGEVLIGNNTNAVTTRAITNLTTAASDVTANTNLITANTLVNYQGSTNQNTIGTITTGAWHGSTIDISYGGTGMTSNPSMLINLESPDADTVFKVTPRPGVTGVLGVGNGGTGRGSITSGELLVGNDTSAVATIAKTNLNTANTVVQRDASGNFSAGTITANLSGKASTAGIADEAIKLSNGHTFLTNLGSSSASSSFDGTADISDIGVTGTLPVGHGGTGKGNLPTGELLVGNDTSAVTTIAKTSANTANTVVQRDASGNFSAGTITASLSGNATSATTATSAGQLSAGHTFQVNLASASVSSSFNGTQDIHDIGVSGKLGVGYGGTGAGSFTAGALLQGNNTSAISVAATKGDTYTPIYINSSGIPTVVTGFYTQKLVRPNQLNGLNDPTLQSLVSTTRANRLAFLPADQIIIEKTTDGGTTWVDAGISDAVKLGLFSEVRSTVSIPLLNGVRNINCGIRITFTAMKYNVPEGTAETQKYNYWNSSYVRSAERYCQLKEFYFWVTSVNDGIKIKAERATGANSTTWQTIYDNDGWAATGWSGCDYIKFTQGVFGGGTNQTGNYWNYRLTFFTRNSTGGTTLATSSTSSAQSIYEIRGYGDTVWTVANNYMANDHLYKFDANKNATFPAKIIATEFSGTMNVSNLSGTVPVSSGGTGAGSFAAGALLQGNNTSAISVASAKGNSTTPIYIDSNGIPQTISSYGGNAATATALASGAKIGISGGITGTATNFTGASDISIPVTELNFNATGFNVSGQLSVGNGGTGRSSLTEGQVLVGNGGSAVALRAILNNTAKSALGWNSGGATHTDNLRLVDVNTIAYWNGAYSGTNSNISYVGTISGGTWQGSTIGVSYGGTGITSNPSMTVNLGSNSADTVFKASPSPGVTGTLGVGNGGTGRGSLALNSTVVGNDSGQVKLIASANGAYYATGANAEPQFGILPEAQGGTGRSDLYTYLGNTYATISDLNNIISANDALIFKGVVDANHPLPTTHSIGWTYKAGDTGTYAGQDCEIGDMIICIANGTTANDNDWVIVQANIDGAVTGPAQGAVQNGALAAFNGNSGKIITKASSAGTSTLPVYINNNGIATTISSYEGNSATATKLASGKTIAISGAVTGTATSFDGSSNITIPTTAIDISKVNSGKLAVSYGGTGVGNLPSGQLVVGNDTGAVTTIQKTSANTANTVVQRDANGNFSAGTITATLSGKASTAGVADEAAKLSNAHTFYVDLSSDSVSSGFDGTQDISDIGVTGTLPVGNGGTGATSFTANSLIQGNGTSALSAITSTIGSNVKPIYLSSGVPTATATEMVRAFSLSGAQDLNTKYDAGIYSIVGGQVTNNPSNGSKYAAMLVVPYRKPSGNTIPDYGWQLATFTQNKDALWFRVSGATSTWRGWRNIVNIAAGTAVGGEHAPVYVTSDGIVTATGTIDVEHGGTGTGSLTKDYVLVGNGTSAVQLIAKSSANNASTIVERDASGNFSAGTITATLSGNASTATSATTATQLAAGHTFQVNLGSSSVSSSFNGTQDISDIGVSGILKVGNGGTGLGSLTKNATLVGNDTSNVKLITSASGAYYATSANGEPQFGTLPVAQGGTGKTSWTQWGVVYASASTTLANTAAGTAGYPLIGAGSAAPAWYGGTVLTGTAATSWKTAINGTTAATSAGAGALTVAGGTYIAKNLYVGDETELNSTLSVGGNSTLSGTLTVSGATQINNTLTVGSASANKATTLNGNLTVTGIVSFSNTTGASTDSNGAVRLAGGMSIKGNIIPTHNTYTLGDSDNKWKEIYVMSFVPDYTYTATKSVAGTWVDLFGGNQTTLETGTYIIQLKVGTAYYSGVCSWINTSAATGVTALYTEIPLHGVQINMAKQYYLRTALDASGLYLQISSSSTGSASVSISVKMKKIM